MVVAAAHVITAPATAAARTRSVFLDVSSPVDAGGDLAVVAGRQGLPGIHPAGEPITRLRARQGVAGLVVGPSNAQPHRTGVVSPIRIERGGGDAVGPHRGPVVRGADMVTRGC